MPHGSFSPKLASAPRGEKTFFSPGDTAHVHTVDGLVPGKVVAVNRFVLLMSDGREYPRRDCHLGRSC